VHVRQAIALLGECEDGVVDEDFVGASAASDYDWKYYL
jgi:hypothetical protein